MITKLVGGYKKTILKNDGVKVNGFWDDIPYMKWKNMENHIAMFQTTNQPCYLV